MSKGGRQIAKAAVVVMALFALSRLLGIVRQAIVAALFGTGSELDAFVVANQIPEAVFLIVAGGALGSAFSDGSLAGCAASRRDPPPAAAPEARPTPLHASTASALSKAGRRRSARAAGSRAR